MLRSIRLVALGVALIASTERAFAQTARLTGQMDETFRTTVLLTGSLEGGQGADPLLSPNAEIPPADLYTGGQLGVLVTKRLRRITFGTDATAGLRYFQDTNRVANLGERVAVSVDAHLGKGQLMLQQTIRHTPFQQLLQFIDTTGGAIALPVTSPDLAVAAVENTVLESAVGYTRPAGRRAELQLRYGYLESRQGSRVDQRMFTVGGGLRRAVGRGLDLRAGYTVRLLRGSPETSRPDLMDHDLDIGVDYRRPLSFSRRSIVGFSTGAGAVTTPQETTYLFTGAGSFQHAFGRTWNASVSIDRRLNVIAGISQPVLATTFNTGVGGMFSSHVGARVRTSLLRGQMGFSVTNADAVPGDTRSFTTESRVFVIFWRRWQWYAEHYYYRHQLSDPDILARTVPPRLARGGLRTGFDLQVTLLRRRR